jgi:aspartate/methionine/tyrosine aminotransferase
MTTTQPAAGAPARSCMGIVDEAARLERTGKPVIHLEKGELDLDTPEIVKQSAIEALHANRTRYSHSTGLPELREAISEYYQRTYGVAVEPACVLVNSGSSAAMLELCLALLKPGDEVVLPDPGYPAYPSFVTAAHGNPVWASAAGNGFMHSAEAVAEHITPATQAVVINFPSNPVGSIPDTDGLRAFAELGPVVISDEVYHGLAFDGTRPHTILEYTDNAVVVGSFSKSFAMTGWRLGYSIVPQRLRATLTRMHENLFVGTNTFVQWAAVTALQNAHTIQQRIREELQRRQERLLDALNATGLRLAYRPRGGFYALVRQPPDTGTSAQFAAELLEQTHVALTPGSAFGPSGEGCVRFSVSASSDQIVEGLARIAEFLDAGRSRPCAGNKQRTEVLKEVLT